MIQIQIETGARKRKRERQIAREREREPVKRELWTPRAKAVDVVRSSTRGD